MEFQKPVMKQFNSNLVQMFKAILRIFYFFNPRKRHYVLSRNPGLSYIFFLYQLLKYNDKRNRLSKSVLFNLSSGKPDRYIFALMLYFKLSGFELYLKPKFSFLSTCAYGDYLRYIFSFLRIRKQRKIDYEYIITDDMDTLTDSKHKKSIFINYENPLDITPDVIQMPFSFHPLIYIENKTLTNEHLFELLTTLRKSIKCYKIFFAGNYNHPFYNTLANTFPQYLNRNQLIETLLNKRSEKIITSLPNNQNSNFEDKIICIHSKASNLSQDNYLQTIAQSHFFLCPPGFLMPFSHNLSEAMSCGTIPILEYNDLMNPPLIDKVNCIAFKGKDGLLQAVDYALKIDKETTEIMKNNVTYYYQKYLAPSSFISKITESKTKTILVKIIAEEISFKN